MEYSSENVWRDLLAEIYKIRSSFQLPVLKNSIASSLSNVHQAQILTDESNYPYPTRPPQLLSSSIAGFRESTSGGVQVTLPPPLSKVSPHPEVGCI